MKFNKWTLGLAAVGAVSLTSVAQAEEKMTAVQAALTSTTISGYVDTSAQWNMGTGNANLPPYAFGAGKADGFNLNVVQLSIAKALDESEWAAGYRADLWCGPDANALGTLSGVGGFALRQAYVALRTPIGNGIDWKVGVFDTIVGYETLESGANPNMTRSYGFTTEPTTHTGVLGTYRVNDSISASLGIANSFGPNINERASNNAESFKTYLGSLALTAPSDWGWVAGSSLYAGIISGADEHPISLFGTTAATAGTHRNHYYAGATVATPVTGLKVGAAFDYTHFRHVQPANVIDDMYAYGLYASFQATEKMSLHGRAEYVRAETADSNGGDLFAITGTLQYDLWQNVISRLELRWDHSDSELFGGQVAGTPTRKNAFMLAANLIYKF